MKKLFFLLIIISFGSMAQVKDTTTIKKRVLKNNNLWYIETTTTTVKYAKIDNQNLFSIENDEAEDERELLEKNRVILENEKKKAERLEKNKLLKEALKKGYTPEVNTLEEIEKVNRIKKKLGL